MAPRVTTLEWPPPRRAAHRGRVALLVLLALLFLGGGTFLSYYVEALWFGSLGFSEVFWTTVSLQARVFLVVTLVTFIVLYGAFHALRPAHLKDLGAGTWLVNGQPVRVPIEPALRLIGTGAAAAIAVLTGIAIGSQWSTFALYWRGGESAMASAATPDPIFARPLSFYLFTLPVWEIVAGWLTTMAFVAFAAALIYTVVAGGTRLLEGRRRLNAPEGLLRGVCATFGGILLSMALRTYLGRF